MRRLVAALLFLVLVNEGDPTTLYAKPPPTGFSPGFAPFGWVQGLLLDPLPFKIRPFDIIMIVLLVMAKKGNKGSERVAPMRRALLLGVAAVVTFFVYGLARGGDARAASWQVYLLLSTVLFAFAVSAHFTTPAHYQMLMRTVIAAGVYRAVMCWFSYLVYVVPGNLPSKPEYLTAHDDSVVWVISILALIVSALAARKSRANLLRVLGIVLFVGAIQWNTRRLAWVGLVMGLVTFFFLLPEGAIKRRVKRGLMIVAPIVAIYVVVGWGRPERIFAPLQSLASVSTQEDRSTKARNAENLGLIATIRAANPVTGTGWGHGYVELTKKYSIAEAMELWPYVPHNSVLGLLTYTGVLGFLGYWLAFPTAVFLNARMAKIGDRADVRDVGVVFSSLLIVCGNQMYGDMGMFSLRTMYLLATTYAAAMRLPARVGVWPGVPKKDEPEGQAQLPEVTAEASVVDAPRGEEPWRS